MKKKDKKIQYLGDMVINKSIVDNQKKIEYIKKNYYKKKLNFIFANNKKNNNKNNSE